MYSFSPQISLLDSLEARYSVKPEVFSENLALKVWWEKQKLIGEMGVLIYLLVTK